MLLASLVTIPAAAPAVGVDSTALRNAVQVGKVVTTLKKLETIADANASTGYRLSGTAGYDQSAAYVKSQLQAAGYTVREQKFDFPFFQERTPPHFERTSSPARVYGEGTDFVTMSYSGSGDVTAAVQPTTDVQIPPGPTPSSSTSGCEATDFPASTLGRVALIQRGTCTFGQKAQNAEAAGAVAAIIFNEGQAGRTDAINGTLGGPGFTIPVLGTTFEVGQELYNLYQTGPAPIAHVKTDTVSETRTTENLIADTAGGRSDRTVVVGAHLDSTADGPAIVDDGTGVATILEIAKQMKALNIQPVNKVRFAFWSAEEEGLLGSAYYVSNLTARERKDIAVNLAFDMLGSTNYVRFVYDGDGSSSGIKGPNGSGAVEDVFTKYFGSQSLPTDPTPLDGRTDYASFTDVGIPAGGLFTGAEGIKTAAQAATYGGTAGTAYHPCYHQECDRVVNVNRTVLDQMSDAAAHAVLTFAMTTSAVNGTDKASDRAGTVSEFHGQFAIR